MGVASFLTFNWWTGGIKGPRIRTKRAEKMSCSLYNCPSLTRGLLLSFRRFALTWMNATAGKNRPNSSNDLQCVSDTMEHEMPVRGSTVVVLLSNPYSNVNISLRQATLPRPFVQFPALLRGVISDLLTSRLCWCRQLAVRHWVTARFRLLQQEPGIRCLVMSGTCLPCSPSATNSRLYCLGCRTLSTDSFSTVSWHWHCMVLQQ